MKNIVLALTGSIAASKGLQLYHLLEKSYHVKLIVTPGAGHFIKEQPNEALTEIFDQPFYDKNDHVAHIAIVENADLFVCYPASLNFMASCAYGLTSEIAALCYAAADCPKIHFPAMNSVMYQSKACQKAMATLKSYGDTIIEPAHGLLACGTTGPGRALEPEQALSIINNFFNAAPSFLAGKKVLLNFGRTRSYIDAVRYITNQSSGQMGLALYQALTKADANVIAVAGDTDVDCSFALYASTNQQMLDAMQLNFDDCQLVIACAALTDFDVVDPLPIKMAKEQEKAPTLALKPSIDVLEELGKQKKHQFLVGFSLQNNFDLDYAINKIRKKNLDAIVINEASAMGSTKNSIIFLTKDGVSKHFEGEKELVATFIVDAIAHVMAAHG